MATVGVACRVRVVLVQVDGAIDAQVRQATFALFYERMNNALAGFVRGDEVRNGVTFGRCIFGVGAYVDV